MINSDKTSMIRSITTVPIAALKEILSVCFKAKLLTNSPKRNGSTLLTMKPIIKAEKTLWVDIFLIGIKRYRHRSARIQQLKIFNATEHNTNPILTPKKDCFNSKKSIPLTASQMKKALMPIFRNSQKIFFNYSPLIAGQ